MLFHNPAFISLMIILLFLLRILSIIIYKFFSDYWIISNFCISPPPPLPRGLLIVLYSADSHLWIYFFKSLSHVGILFNTFFLVWQFNSCLTCTRSCDNVKKNSFALCSETGNAVITLISHGVVGSLWGTFRPFLMGTET